MLDSRPKGNDCRGCWDFICEGKAAVLEMGAMGILEGDIEYEILGNRGTTRTISELEKVSK
jgi:hypothetical protein